MANINILLRDARRGHWLHFREPAEVFCVREPAGVVPALRAIEARIARGRLYAAGFMAYEAAPAFDPALPVRADESGFPLLCFGVFASPERVAPPGPRGPPPATPAKWESAVAPDRHAQAIARIKAYIAEGRTYQVNYTFRLRAPFTGDAWEWFARLAAAQQAPYAAFVDIGDWAICSASPELFFEREGERLLSRPMKGTAARGRTTAEDALQANQLKVSPKNRAENIMIVDMVRNDIGRVAAPGSVVAESLFDVERHPAVWQMTSTVSGRTAAGLADIFQALFPAASITGAPKPATMGIIAELETDPRRVYTGCIGYAAPGGRAQFNVAIRTVLIDRRAGRAEYGTGGGVVWDSTASGEYNECLLKARVVSDPPADFELLETLRWEPGKGYFLLDWHLARLADSAAYFSIPLNIEAVRAELESLTPAFPAGPCRVRRRVGRDGRLAGAPAWRPRAARVSAGRVGLARTPVDSSNVFLFHKTTRRAIYAEKLAERPDCEEVILWNEKGELTESTIANLVVERNGQFYTPPVVCGLLPGTYRAWLLAQRRVCERVLTRSDLRAAERIWLVNSVRGARAVQLPAALA